MDYSREYKCNNNQGGANKIYLFPFIDYLDSQITVTENILTNFPYNVIYDMNAFNINYTNDVSQDKDITYNEKISFQIKKILEKDNFKQFVSQDYRLIIKDNNGKIRLFGLKNGLTGNYKEEIGTNRNEFNGYSFSFEGKEEDSAPYLNDLNLFGVMNMGGLLLQDGNDNLIQDGNNNIITN